MSARGAMPCLHNMATWGCETEDSIKLRAPGPPPTPPIPGTAPAGQCRRGPEQPFLCRATLGHCSPSSEGFFPPATLSPRVYDDG